MKEAVDIMLFIFLVEWWKRMSLCVVWNEDDGGGQQ
jgi:hypothetical protein